MKKDENKPTDLLAEAIKDLEKKYGTGVVLTNDETPVKVEAMSTGSYSIDYLLGCGGLPKGRMIEMFGEPSAGKSTMSLFFAGTVQKQGGTVAYLDAENAYDADYASKLGVDTKKLLVSQPETLEETFDIIRAFSETNQVDLIIVDSVASLVPKQELEEENMFKETMALQARALSKGLRILTGPVARSKTTVIFLNQTRSKVGVIYGAKETTVGGKSLKFYSSIRLSVKKGERIMGAKEEQVGTELRITAEKNKVGFPFRSGIVRLYYGSGIDMVSDAFFAASDREIIVKEGNTYKFKDTKLGVGQEQALKKLKEEEPLYQELRKAIDKEIQKEVSS